MKAYPFAKYLIKIQDPNEIASLGKMLRQAAGGGGEK